MCLSVFQVEGMIPHKIDLKTLGMILLGGQEVWDGGCGGKDLQDVFG